MKKVAIVQRTLVQYRREFFDGLKNALAEEGVELTLIYGKQSKDEGLKNDEMDLEWGKYIPNITIKLGSKNLIWQPCLNDLKDKDLVIVEQANKLLLNYFLILVKRFYGIKLAFWGHGRDRNLEVESLLNKFKYLFIKKCDWWFAYTSGVRSFLINKGYSEHKITDVQNAIDTQFLRKKYLEIDSSDIENIKMELGIMSEHIGIFCGSMYAEKRIDFIVECCLHIKQKIEDFHMIFVGAGVDAKLAIDASEKYDWIHYVGPKFGEDRVKYFKVAAIQMMPGAVGLGVLDSFTLETPLITTYNPSHGPEIDYIEDGVNGIITNDNVDEYTHAIIDLLSSGKYINMIENCKKSAQKYTIENMIENFKTGILKAVH